MLNSNSKKKIQTDLPSYAELLIDVFFCCYKDTEVQTFVILCLFVRFSVTYVIMICVFADQDARLTD